jgi:uncharacterized protein
MAPMSEVRCVTCGKPTERRPANRFYPFCSHRCRLVDLGKWLGEEYRVASGPEEMEDEVPSEDRDGGEREH